MMLHPENKEAFNKLYIKISDANPQLQHKDVMTYTEIIFRASLEADTAIFKHLYMQERKESAPPTDPTLLECGVCQGSGGWDRSKDCEAYEEWEDCPACGGTGELLE